MPEDLASHADPTPGARDLCLTCGICCSGALFAWGDLEPCEVAGARAQGLAPVKEAGRDVFGLPCPCHEGLCTIYAQRPRDCRTFECHTLVRLKAGDLRFEEAVAVVAEAKRLLQRLAEEAGGAPQRGVWERVEDVARESDMSLDTPAFARTHPHLALAAAACTLYLTRHFHPIA